MKKIDVMTQNDFLTKLWLQWKYTWLSDKTVNNEQKPITVQISVHLLQKVLIPHVLTVRWSTHTIEWQLYKNKTSHK